MRFSPTTTATEVNHSRVSDGRSNKHAPIIRDNDRRRRSAERGIYYCVFRDSSSALSDCEFKKQYLSQLRRHHEKHGFFYCSRCFITFESSAARDDHGIGGNSCTAICVEDGCPGKNNPLSRQGSCSHRDNSQRAQWTKLFELARPAEQVPDPTIIPQVPTKRASPFDHPAPTRKLLPLRPQSPVSVPGYESGASSDMPNHQEDGLDCEAYKHHARAASSRGSSKGSIEMAFYPCVFHCDSSVEQDETPHCKNGQRYVSLLKKHHESKAHSRPFFYCTTCLEKFHSPEARDEHDNLNQCIFRCATEGCPNFEMKGPVTCAHGQRNDQRSIWRCLWRLAHDADESTRVPDPVQDNIFLPPAAESTVAKSTRFSESHNHSDEFTFSLDGLNSPGTNWPSLADPFESGTGLRNIGDDGPFIPTTSAPAVSSDLIAADDATLILSSGARTLATREWYLRRCIKVVWPQLTDPSSLSLFTKRLLDAAGDSIASKIQVDDPKEKALQANVKMLEVVVTTLRGWVKTPNANNTNEIRHMRSFIEDMSGMSLQTPRTLPPRLTQKHFQSEQTLSVADTTSWETPLTPVSIDSTPTVMITEPNETEYCLSNAEDDDHFPPIVATHLNEVERAPDRGQTPPGIQY